MFPKSKRVNLNKDFKWVASGAVIRGNYFRLFARKGENKEPRVGVAIPGKKFKRAVDRNKAKRVLYRALGKVYQDLPGSINIIVLPNTRALEVKSDELDQEVRRLLPRLKDLT